MKELVVAGDPVEHSKSPVMQNAALKKMGLENEFVYKKKQVKKKELPQFIDYLRTIEGANITIPHKEDIIPYLDELTKEAQFIGAVNTIYKNNNKLIGHNTDGQGAVEALKDKVKIENSRVLIIGAGGASRAIAFTLALHNPRELIIMNRTVEKAQELAKQINSKTGAYTRAVSFSHNPAEDVVVNTTSLGMKGENQDLTPLTREKLKPGMAVMDIVYNPLQTRLLKEAKEAGCKTIDGVGMFVNQGALALQIWTGQQVPRQVMREAVLNSLNT